MPKKKTTEDLKLITVRVPMSTYIKGQEHILKLKKKDPNARVSMTSLITDFINHL